MAGIAARMGKVIKSYIAKMSGTSTNAQFGAVEEFAGDERTTQYYGPANEDFAPPANCKTFNIPLGAGRGLLLSLAYHNPQIEPVAVQGEFRKFSTNEAGDTVMAEVFCKKDGQILLKNAIGLFDMKPDGTTFVNGAKIDPSGEVWNAAGLSLGGHKHSQANDGDGDSEQDVSIGFEP